MMIATTPKIDVIMMKISTNKLLALNKSVALTGYNLSHSTTPTIKPIIAMKVTRTQ